MKSIFDTTLALTAVLAFSNNSLVNAFWDKGHLLGKLIKTKHTC